MLKISRTAKSFTRLDTPTLAAASILERADLQEYIFNSSEAFFAEIGETLFIIGKEVIPSETVQDRIDLLAVDKQGRLVIAELKRGNDKLQLLQAISYAGMVAKWTPAEIKELAAGRADALGEFLDVEPDDLNREQRILLIAEAYDYEVLVAAEWLYQTYGVEIACSRVALAVDSAGAHEYLTCSQVFPTPELAEQAISRSRRQYAPRPGAQTWEDVIAGMRVPALGSFVRKLVESSPYTNSANRVVYLKIGNRVRFNVEARREHCTVWQAGRFEDDVDYWRGRLSNPASVELKKNPPLRFFLETAQDCSAFEAALVELANREWLPVGAAPVAEGVGA